jgi:hypothetical protein
MGGLRAGVICFGFKSGLYVLEWFNQPEAARDGSIENNRYGPLQQLWQRVNIMFFFVFFPHAMICDACMEDLNGDGVLKQPCGHRIHKKCDLSNSSCPGCKVSSEHSGQFLYVMLVILGIFIGVFVGVYLHKDPVSHSIREIESNLRSLEQVADRSYTGRQAVVQSLKRIAATVDQEMIVVRRN